MLLLSTLAYKKVILFNKFNQNVKDFILTVKWFTLFFIVFI